MSPLGQATSSREHCGAALGRHGQLDAARSDHGSASVWVLTSGLLVLVAAMTTGLRENAVIARHRAEAAADLAALAAAQGIGVDSTVDQMCQRAARIAKANGADLGQCTVRLEVSARTGSVQISTSVAVRIAGLGEQRAHAHAQAARLPP